MPAEEAWLQALIIGPGAFTRVSGIAVEEGYCEFDGALSYSLDSIRRAASEERHWFAPRLFVDRETRRLVGLGGYKGAPLEGMVEIGYAVAPAFRSRGLATEAVEGLTNAAFFDPAVKAVVAHTLAEPNASTKVLQKCGFAYIGETMMPEDGAVWRWEHARPE